MVHAAVHALAAEGVTAGRGDRLVEKSVAQAALQVLHQQQGAVDMPDVSRRHLLLFCFALCQKQASMVNGQSRGAKPAH